MRLTSTIRTAFVSSAMNDVPQIDYQEQFRAEAMRIAVARLPEKIAKLWNSKETREWVMQIQTSGGWGGWSVCLPGIDHDAVNNAIKETRDAFKKLDEEQDKKIRSLRQSLSQAANAATTRKQLAEMLPEFEKYLPADESAANRALPVVQNIAAEFIKAGWPKPKK